MMVLPLELTAESQYRCDLRIVAGVDQIDPEAAVREDRVLLNSVPRTRIDQHAIARVEGDDVTRAWRSPANRVTVTIGVNACTEIPKGLGTGQVRADVVPLDQIAAVEAKEQDAVSAIARDDVAGSGRRPANDVAAVRVGKQHANASAPKNGLSPPETSVPM